MTTPPTLEDRLVISPGNGMFLAPSANLPVAFTLEFADPVRVQIFYFPTTSVSVICNGNPVPHTDRKPETIRLKKSRKTIDIELRYTPFTEEDTFIELAGRRKLNVDLLEQTAYRIIHGKRGVPSQARSLFDYVHHIPALGVKGHPYRSDKVIEWGVARKCVDKARLFVDLCRAVGIPAREERGIRYYPLPGQKGYGYGHHAWTSYFDGTEMQSADPSDGHLAQHFPSDTYFHTTSTLLQITGDKRDVSWRIYWKDTPQPNSLLRPSNFMDPFLKVISKYWKSSRTIRV